MENREFVVRSREIEDAANLVLQTVKGKKHSLCPNRELTDIELLCPKRVAETFGIKYLEIKGMGQQAFPQRGKNFKVAGSLDMQSLTIAIDADNSEVFKRFTAMHEIGHVVLHPDMEKVHRDVLRGGKDLMDKNQPQHEREANFFAANALMPRALLSHEFVKRFGNELPFEMEDVSAWITNPTSHQEMTRLSRRTFLRESLLATCTNYKGRNFRSLASHFMVSAEAMKYRIREIGLLKNPQL